MKTLLLFVLAVLAVGSSSVVNGPASRYNLNVGYITAGDRQLYRTYIIKNAAPNAIQYQDVIFRGNRNTRIAAVYAFEVNNTQYASAWIIAGGVGHNSTTVRFQTARGYGYYYQFEVWGR